MLNPLRFSGCRIFQFRDKELDAAVRGYTRELDRRKITLVYFLEEACLRNDRTGDGLLCRWGNSRRRSHTYSSSLKPYEQFFNPEAAFVPLLDFKPIHEIHEVRAAIDRVSVPGLFWSRVRRGERNSKYSAFPSVSGYRQVRCLLFHSWPGYWRWVIKITTPFTFFATEAYFELEHSRFADIKRSRIHDPPD